MGDSDGDSDTDGTASTGFTGATAGGFGAAGGSDGGPTTAPNATRPPQQNTSVEVIPNPATDTIRCRVDIRVHSSDKPTTRSFRHGTVNPSWQ
ncbi:hypothetical protein Pme01_04590 [Planosporangium mesophilum]|uniref:Uncharacterized protein n=1 Tax=Planosporangium mesophilum TaxID=689768 RepID=A0A8J3T919_9ACTN|nr:hypothetical protein Pme01_04590 [Planosporangium mesophilum]